MELVTVVVHSEDGRPAHGELSEGLPGGGRDVVPAFSCLGDTYMHVKIYKI